MSWQSTSRLDAQKEWKTSGMPGRSVLKLYTSCHSGFKIRNQDPCDSWEEEIADLLDEVNLIDCPRQESILRKTS